MDSVEQVRAIRAFNRLVTQRVGALEDRFLGRDRPLGQSRVLFEIGAAGADLRDLRTRLGLDSGYLTRLTGALQEADLVRVEPAFHDERVRRAELTAAGLAEVEEMDRRADALAAGLLEPLTEGQRARLVAAAAEVSRMLLAAGVRITRVPPSSPAARWCVASYYAELDRRFEEGFDPGRSLPADDADLTPPRGAFLVASVDGRTLGGGALKTITAGVGSIKRMWVAAESRGLGLGHRLLAALEDEARRLGLARLLLETNHALAEARSLYASAGYREVDAFNDDPYADHWFEKSLEPEP